MSAVIEHSYSGSGQVPAALATSVRSASSAPIARPLFLTRQVGVVVVHDGPSLIVRAGRRTPMRYPFARLSRVVSSLAVDWQAAALTACIRAGVPVVFVERDGKVAGYVQPMARSASNLNRLIDEWLAESEWRDTYENWLRSERMRIFSKWAKGLAEAGRMLEARELAELSRQYVHVGKHPTTLGEKQGLYRAALLALVAEQVRKAGLQPRYPGFGGATLDLVDDLCRLLEVALALELHGLGSGANLGTPVMLRVLHAFGPRLTNLCGGVLGRLYRRVLEEVERWR